eukprot:5586992-Amphidinium_carterae.1
MGMRLPAFGRKHETTHPREYPHDRTVDISKATLLCLDDFVLAGGARSGRSNTSCKSCHLQ